MLGLTLFATVAVTALAHPHQGTASPSVALTPARPATDWMLETTGDSPEAMISMEGPLLRIVSPEPALALSKRFVLTGDFTLHAAFLPRAMNKGAFGFAFGRGQDSKNHLAVVVRPDGSVTLEGHDSATAVLRQWDAAHSWRGSMEPVTVRIQVTGGRAALFVNDKKIGEVNLPSGRFEGSAGVYVGAGADLSVSGFTITATRASLR